MSEHEEQQAQGEEQEPGDERPPRRGVQFPTRESKMEVVKRISRVSQAYSPDEIIAVWGDSNEFRLRKQELKQAVVAMQTGRRVSDNFTFTTKGLTDKIGEGKRIKKESRVSGWQAVLDEQYNQEIDGIVDPESVANAYQKVTGDAKVKALREGLRMHQEVTQLVEGEDNDGDNNKGRGRAKPGRTEL